MRSKGGREVFLKKERHRENRAVIGGEPRFAGAVVRMILGWNDCVTPNGLGGKERGASVRTKPCHSGREQNDTLEFASNGGQEREKRFPTCRGRHHQRRDERYRFSPSSGQCARYRFRTRKATNKKVSKKGSLRLLRTH